MERNQKWNVFRVFSIRYKVDVVGNTKTRVVINKDGKEIEKPLEPTAVDGRRTWHPGGSCQKTGRLALRMESLL